MSRNYSNYNNSNYNRSNYSGYEYLNNMNTMVTNYYMLTCSSIGIPLNLLSILTFARLVNNKTNMSFLYICQSLVDINLFLVNLLVVRSPTLFFNTNFINQSNALCQLITYLRRFTLHTSSWTTVLITVDRFIFVIYKNRFKLMQSKWFLCLLILAMFAIITVLDTPNFLFYLSSNSNKTFQTYKSCVSDMDETISSDFISIMLRTYIPFVVMIVLNGIMIKKIMKSSRMSLKQTINHQRKEYQFTISVMLVNVFFFVVNLPESVFNIVYDYYLYSGVFLSSSTFRLTYYLIAGIFSDFSLLFQTFSFFSYLAFNRVFRRQFKILFLKIFFCIPKRTNEIRVAPVANLHESQLTTKTR